MLSVEKTIFDKRFGYDKNDYRVFVTRNCDSLNPHTNKKQLYITYEGMIKILYSSRSKKAKSFRNWATKTLFVAQMGDVEEKEELASKLIGVPVKSLRLVLSKTASSVPCVYMFSLGVAKDLRDVMDIPDTVGDGQIIIKYGFTKSLERRTNEHVKTFSEIKKVNLELLYYSYIDPIYLSNAEKDIKDFVSQYETVIKYKKFKELISVSPAHQKLIKKQLGYINKEYAGCTQELTEEIKKLKQVIKDKNRDIEDANKEIIKYKKEMETQKIIQDFKIKMKEKDILDLKKEIETQSKIYTLELKMKNQEIKMEVLKNAFQNKK